MKLGLFPGLGGGLIKTAEDGQVDRLITYYLQTYAHHFQHLYYFSYHQEKLSDYTTDPILNEKVSVVPRLRNMHYRLYALRLPQLAQETIQQCKVMRVFQARGALPAMVAKRQYGIPFITTYGYNYAAFSKIEGNRIAYWLHRLLAPLTLRMAAGVIVTTQELHDHVAQFVFSDKIHLIPNGVDTTTFSPNEAVQPLSPPTILFVGRLTPQKNLPRLLEAAAQLKQKIQLKIIGQGPLHAELRALAASLGLNCHFLGNVPHHQLPHHFQTATLFVLPSFIEGHPKVLIEAMSCGLPCIASACDGNQLLIQHQKNGLLFAPKDTQVLQQHLHDLLTNPDQAQYFGQAARQYIIGHLDIYTLLQQEIALLQATTNIK